LVQISGDLDEITGVLAQISGVLAQITSALAQITGELDLNTTSPEGLDGGRPLATLPDLAASGAELVLGGPGEKRLRGPRRPILGQGDHYAEGS
jgi:hypothetical protein